MAEELRIVVQDQGASGGQGTGGQLVPRAPTALTPAGGRAGRFDTRRALSGIQGLERFGGAVAGGRLGTAAALGGSAAVTGAAAVAGPLAVAVAGLVATVGVAAVAVKAFGSAVQTQVSQLAGVSTQVAAAAAQTAVGRELGLIQRGARIGAPLAEAESIRREFAGALFDINTEILRILLDIANQLRPVLQPILDLLRSAEESLKNVDVNLLEALASVVEQFAPLAAVAIRAEATLREIQRDQAERNQANTFTQQFLDLLPQANARVRRGMAQAGALDAAVDPLANPFAVAGG